jgi:site-specific DNA-methyltransferase (adenine-specific)
MSTIVLQHGDCLDLLADVKDESVPLLVTDPPYFTPPAQFVSGRSHHKRSLANLSLLDHFYADWFAALLPKMREDASLYIFCDSQSYPLYYAYLYGYVKSLRLLVWDRGTAQNGYTWRYQCQYILFAQMPDAPAIKTGDGDLLKYRSVPVAQRVHAAEKPQDLLQKLITKSSQPGDLVLDTFAGSASTGLACISTGRAFLGFELDYRCFQESRARLVGCGR